MTPRLPGVRLFLRTRPHREPGDDDMTWPKITAIALVLASCAGAKTPKTAAPASSSPSEQAPARNVAIVVYKGVELLDFAGPGEVFASAGNGAFNVFTVATTIEPVVSQGFVKV